MFRSLLNRLKQFVTAIVLLLVAVLTAELILHLRRPQSVAVVSERASADVQSMLVPSETRHHELKRLSALTSGDGTEFQTNSLGLRGVEPTSERSSSLLRVLVLGDETVFGGPHTVEETLSGRLQQFLTQATDRTVEVINGGVPGYSPLLSLIHFQNELQQLKPDVVILHFDMTDVADDSTYRRRIREAGDKTICTNPLHDQAARMDSPLVASMKNSAIVQFTAETIGLTDSRFPTLQQRYEWTTNRHHDLRLQISHALSPLESMQRLAGQNRFHLLVTTSPVPWQVASAEDFPSLRLQLSSQTMWPVTQDMPMQILNAACEQQRIRVCDTTAAFRSFSKPEKLFEADNVALSAYGHALYAREVAAKLLQTEELAGLFAGRHNLSTETREVQ